MGSHHLVTVCMFCLLCATHSSCSAHTEVSQKGLRRIHDLRHEKFKTSDSSDLNKNYVRTLARMKRVYTEVPRVESVKYSEDIQKALESRLAPDVNSKQNHENNNFEPSLDLKLHSSSYYGKDEINRDIVSKSQPPKNSFSEDKRLFKHRENKSRVKRSAHLLESENGKNLDGVFNEKNEDLFYKALFKNIDIDFYIKKLFAEFGDRDTMTMNLIGFEKMLRKLDLHKMILAEHGYFHSSSGIFQPAPVESVINGVRSNSTNVTCVNSVDLIVSLNEQLKPNHQNDQSSSIRHVKSSQLNESKISLNKLKRNITLNSRILTKVCPILLYQKVAQTSYERQGCIVEREFPKIVGAEQYADYEHLSESLDHQHDDDELNSYDNNRTAVWVYSSLCILAISACGLLGVAVIPIMDHTYYQQILQFLVALAIGTLSGDAMLHLLPHALSPDEHGHGKRHSHSAEKSHSHDGMWKGLVAVMGVVFFYFTEKGLTLVAEWRKRRMRLDKENKLPPRVRVMRNDNLSCIKNSGNCSSRASSSGFLKFPTGIFKPNSKSAKQSNEANNVNSGKICKHKYSEYPYCYDEIATDTHDDHHIRDTRLNSINKLKVNSADNNKYLPKVENNEDHHLCVVSVNNVKETNIHSNNHEPTVNDALMIHNYDDNITEVQAHDQANNANNTKVLDNLALGVENNTSSNFVDVKDDKKIELEEIDEKKSLNDKESYTVILREHSQTHHGHSHSHGHVHSPPSSLSSVVWMVIMGDGIHNFTDGMAIGAAFSSNIAGGFSTAIAVLCHELPHEIGDFAVLLKAGMSAKRAVFYNLLSSILCLFGMVLGVIVGHTPEATAWVFAAAAGMFMYIALVDMIPELTSSHSNEGSFCQCILQFFGLASGIGIMLLIAMYEHELKKLFG